MKSLLKTVRAGLKPAPYCLLALLLPLFAFAQNNGVTISNFSAKAGSPATLTFNVQWAPLTNGKAWSDTVWVFVDYNNAGTMTRLPLNPTAATLTWHSATNCPDCGVDRDRSNPNGVWVVGNARTAGAFSATVRAGVGAGFKPAPTPGACVYATNYPPEGQYTAVDKIKFNGTPPFELKFNDGSSYSLSRQEAQSTYTVPAGKTLQSFTDATGAPGNTRCKTPAVQTLNASASSYCEGSGVTLSLNGTERGVIYQLYNGNSPFSGATVTGSGPSATFTKPDGSPLFSWGTYEARVAPTSAFCAATMNGTRTIQLNRLPAVPTSPSANARCGAGTVTFSATTVTAGSTIDWYTADTGGSTVSGGYGVTSLSPTLTKTTTYYAQARNTTTGCVSATRLAVTGKVNAIPAVPTGASANVRCGDGTVTFSATASAGCTIDWYTAGSGGSTVSNSYGVTSFSPKITGPTTYYAQARNTTTGCISTTRLAVGGTINAIPIMPFNASANARCGAGTVTFSATAYDGTTIDWYTAGTGGSTVSGGYGVTSLSPTLQASTTYYAQARVKTTGCVSTTRLAVAATIISDIPSVSISPSATITLPNTTVTFTANPSNCVNGCTYKWSNSSTTQDISVAAPDHDKTAYYSCTVTNSVGCTASALASVTGSFFLSTAVWTYGKYIWSDHVVAKPSGCTSGSLSRDENPPPQYKVNNGRHYYNWSCVNQYPTQLCPPGWSVPTSDQLNALTQATTPSELASAWGYGGIAIGSGVSYEDMFGCYWSSTALDTRSANGITYAGNDAELKVSGTAKFYGLQVRCVKQ